MLYVRYIENQYVTTIKLQIMQIQYPISQNILQKVQEMKKQIDTKKFCELHGISESKFSRFPSKKLIQEIELIDYMHQFLEFESKFNYALI